MKHLNADPILVVLAVAGQRGNGLALAKGQAFRDKFGALEVVDRDKTQRTENVPSRSGQLLNDLVLPFRTRTLREDRLDNVRLALELEEANREWIRARRASFTLNARVRNWAGTD